MKLESYTLSGFADMNRNGLITGLKGYAKFDQTTDLSGILSVEPRSAAWQARVMVEKQFNAHPQNRKLLEKLISKLTSNSSFEPVTSNGSLGAVTSNDSLQTTTSNASKITTHFFKPPADTIEEFLVSLPGFPLKAYQQVSSFIILGQNNNHLLIIFGVVIFLIRVNLQSKFDCQILENKIYRNKPFGRFRWEYIFSGYLVNIQFIESVYNSQRKDANGLDLYEITNDFKYYRSGLENFLQLISRVVLFYFILPIFSMLQKVVIGYIWQCFSFFLSFFSFCLIHKPKIITESPVLLNINFFFSVLFVAFLTYLPIIWTNQLIPIIDKYAFIMCSELSENRYFYSKPKLNFNVVKIKNIL